MQKLRKSLHDYCFTQYGSRWSCAFLLALGLAMPSMPPTTRMCLLMGASQVAQLSP